MTEQENKIWEAVTAVLNHTATCDQHALFQQWLNEGDTNRTTFEVLSKVRRVKEQPSIADKDDIYERIHSGIRKSQSRRFVRMLIYGNAASILIIITLSIGLAWLKPANRDIYIETRCPLGTKSKLILADGTTVHLNSGSVLEYPAVFSKNSRQVKLRGEAFFEVVRDSKRAFIVNTGAIGVKVFGTKFNVKNYDSDKSIETTLVEGKVGIVMNNGRSHHPALMLKPNEQAMFEKQTGKLTSRSMDAEMVSIWKVGKYFFEDETFEEIAQKLEREFNTPIVITSRELRKEIFTGMFDKNKTIYQMLDLMKRKRDFSYRQENDTIVITRK
ncbi:MAG TPA: FecR domain-containing protein [Bacteroidales bacterium]|nr:FecR domain-containing protein [Bacteroidales bacterium]